MCCLMEPFGGLRASGLTCSPSLWTAPIVRHINKIYMGLKWKHTHTHSCKSRVSSVTRVCLRSTSQRVTQSDPLFTFYHQIKHPTPPHFLPSFAAESEKQYCMHRKLDKLSRKSHVCDISKWRRLFHVPPNQARPKKKENQTQAQNPDAVAKPRPDHSTVKCAVGKKWLKMAKNG